MTSSEHVEDSANAVAPATETPRGTRQRLEHVDAMRPIKQTAVISTHALIYFSPLATSFAAASMLTLTHFSRDAFLFVSACMLAYSYRDSDGVAIGPYWKRRFVAVGSVYLVWTLIYFPLAAARGSTSFPYLRIPGSAVFSLSGLHTLLFNFATGYYHLYFLLVLLQFYLVFPYVFWCLKRYPNARLAVVAGALVWQIFYPIIVRRDWIGIIMSPKIETRLVISYPLYLLGGVVCAFYLENFHDWIVRHRKGILASTVLVAVVPLVVDYLSDHGVKLSGTLVPGANPFAALVIPYDVGAILAVYLLGVYLVSPRRSARTRAITASGSEAAYGIYVSQMVWIIVEQRWIAHYNLHQRVPWLALTLAAVVVTYFLGWLFSALFARTPLARPLVGRAQLPWRTLWPHPLTGSDEPDFGEGPLNLTDR
ncbi:MAG: acyltransferase family protein [Acidimicrobiales bacterium]